jgi:hypothetical protein
MTNAAPFVTVWSQEEHVKPTQGCLTLAAVSAVCAAAQPFQQTDSKKGGQFPDRTVNTLSAYEAGRGRVTLTLQPRS